MASANLFEMLNLSIASAAWEQAKSAHLPALVLSVPAARQRFTGDADPVGRIVEVAGQRALVVGILPEDSWRLPGRFDGWLLENEDYLATLKPESTGFLLAHCTRTLLAETHGRWRMIAPGADSADGYVGFDCVSLTQLTNRPFSFFLFALLLACLALPATTPLSLGDYPAGRGSAPWPTLFRRWAFLSVKVALILPIVYCGSLSLAYLDPSLGANSSQYIQLLTAFAGCLFAFRWSLRDQRQRCPVCLRLLSNPARVGEPSRNFLTWNGTELMCGRGHGFLHVPEIPTSWCSTQRWLHLDPSWKTLFHEARVLHARPF